jgi:hypothetical protein
MLNLNPSNLVAQVSMFSALGFFIVLAGPIIRSIFGLPGGWMILPVFISYLELLKGLDSSYPLWVGAIIGVIASFLPMMGGIGPISFFIGLLSGLCAFIFNFEKFYTLKLIISSLILISIVSAYLGFFVHFKVVLYIYGLTILISVFWGYAIKNYKIRIENHLKKIFIFHNR